MTSAYLLPFPDPRGGWMDHIRMKVFPPFKPKKTKKGTKGTPGTVKYLQPPRSGVRIYFPLATLDAVLHSADPLYVVEGEKKSLAVAQKEGKPTIGLSGIDCWHRSGERTLHPDLDDVGLAGRIVYVIPDADYQTNAAVARAVQGLAAGAASAERGECPHRPACRPTATASTTT